MGLFKISPGIPDKEESTNFIAWDDRLACPDCGKPHTQSQCEKHPNAKECCYNMHLRKQHLKVVDII